MSIHDAYYIGYSLDTVMEAVSATTSTGKSIQIVATGELGAPLDMYGDMLSEKYLDIIRLLLPADLDFTEYMNPRYYYLPYDCVKIVNRSNGAIQYPISARSFDSEAEWKEMCTAMELPEVQEVLGNKSLAPSKFVTAVKNHFPKAFADTFVKAMQNIRWRGMQLSQFSMMAFGYEFSMEHATDPNYNEYYMKPKVSYAELCRMLCERFHIDVAEGDTEYVRRLITDRRMEAEVVIMDNRIDQYMDYVCGKFDRCRMWAENIAVPEQLIHARDGLYYTPLSSSWAVTVFNGVAKKLMCEPINTLYYQGISEIPSTKANVKMYSQYADLVGHYGNKRLDLAQRIETMIK